MSFSRFICQFLRSTARNREHALRRLRKLRNQTNQSIDSLSGGWTTYETVSDRWQSHSLMTTDRAPLIAVVMQGPIVEDRDFTYQTLQLYRDLLATDLVIVSTWDDSNRNTVAKIRSLGFRVELSAKPEAGPRNVNLQITSSHVGIEVAAMEHADFVIKTRTDCRLHLANWDRVLWGLMDSFGGSTGVGRAPRIGTLDYATRLYIPNHLSDILMFGETAELLHYWSVDHLDFFDEPDCEFGLLKHFFTSFIPEIYLCEAYLGQMSGPEKRTLEHWWKTLGERFLIVNRDFLHMHWWKYNYGERHRIHLDEENRYRALCRFEEWVVMYTGQAQITAEFRDIEHHHLDDLVTATYPSQGRAPIY